MLSILPRSPKYQRPLSYRLAAAIKVLFGDMEKEHTVATQMLLCDVAVRKKKKALIGRQMGKQGGGWGV